MFKKTYTINGKDITDLTEIINNSKYKNIPYKIKYNEYIFYICCELVQELLFG